MGLFSGLLGGGNNKAKYFRNLKNMLGIPEIEGLEFVTDSRIVEIYNEVKDTIATIAVEKNEAIPERVIDGLVRDRLIDEIHGNYQIQLDNMKNMYTSYEIRSTFFKGRTY